MIIHNSHKFQLLFLAIQLVYIIMQQFSNLHFIKPKKLVLTIFCLTLILNFAFLDFIFCFFLIFLLFQLNCLLNPIF